MKLEHWITIAIAVIGGAYAMVTKRPSWRNWFTREFKLKINVEERISSRFVIVKMLLGFKISCNHNEEIFITGLYYKLPRKLFGTRNNFALGNVRGRYYIPCIKTIKSLHEETLKVPDQILVDIYHRKIKRLKLVIETTRYGNVSSNTINVEKLINQVRDVHIRHLEYFGDRPLFPPNVQ